MLLDPRRLNYEEIDPPVRELIRILNSQTWLRTYGCCAGPRTALAGS